MNKYRVSVWRKVETNGWIEVEAETAGEAVGMVEDMDGWEMEAAGEWGGCGDTDEYGVDGYVEEIIEPTVSEGLWK